MKKKIILFLYLFTIYLTNVYSQNEVVDSLLNKFENTTNDTNKVNILCSISKYLLYRNPDKAMEYNNQAIDLTKDLDFHKGLAAALDISGIYYQNKGEYDKTEDYYQKSLDIRKEINKPNLIALSYNNFGVLNRRKGDFDISKDYFLKSLAISKEQKDSAALSRVYNNLGLVLGNIGDYEESIDYHLQSLRIREKTGSKGEVASSLNNIGLVFIAIEKYDEANDYLLRSLKIKKEIGNERSLASTYLNVGTVKFYQGKYDESLDYHSKSLKIYNMLEDKKSIGAVVSNMAYIARKKGDLNQAIKYNLESIRLIEEIGSKDQLCESYNSLASTYIELKNYKKATQYAQKAKEIAELNNILPQLKSTLHWLYGIENAQGNYKQAICYLEQHMKLKDSLFNEINNKQIIELQTKYDTEKKEKEIALLSETSIQQELELEKRNKTILMLIGVVIFILVITLFIIKHNKIKQRQNTLELEQALFRSQMNPHFIFNAISAIQHYIHKNKSLEASSYLSSFAKLMRSILNNSKVELVTLETEKQTLEDYLKLQSLRLDGNLDYTIKELSELESDELAIPPMLLQPFVENAIEHGILKKKSQTGKIDIHFSEKDNKLLVEIIDDGIGREKAGEIKDKRHKSFATDITNSRIKSMKQSYKKGIFFDILDLKNSENDPIGTKVIFKLPLTYI